MSENFHNTTDAYIVFYNVFNILGLWGEVRAWNDGTTVVQKTHDASKGHVQEVSGFR